MAKKLKQDISIGANLRKYRQAINMSQEEVASKLQVQGLDIHQKIISEMELGKYSIRISVLLALADLYNKPVQCFFMDLNRYDKEPPEKSLF
ncbi:MAG: helix-turn-helix transcriptional regulator [Defluviitaleaceae bacterium]|nr:helix-turn-helix transcriptional regulator [Defluviitaleaceae bacterium]